ncbi:PAS domain-containing protein [Massilia sp. IC2-477]|uniref:PAS domain-containing hybrid sensor histidine kinase/response regulator n=1 Tax=Massilia sp. IC2-477 TaxID=2887198 RepID=UPI001D10783A|nr:PAS domain-containing protein [Massilia sp. IC2-477]MCC2954610.1 PAS domain-containing protein [Massilia sp. IC2-477]
MFLTAPTPAGKSDTVETLMAAHDWRATPCGEPSGWEPALQYALRQMLDAAVPMFMVWGEAETFLYNDAYVPILGLRHPHALGQSFEHVWPEAYPAVAPAVANAMAGQPTSFSHAPFVVTRNGVDEQVSFSFTYSPLRRLDGTVLGFSCVVLETTDIDAWRRSEAALHDAQLRLEAALGAAQVATWNWDIRANRVYADANLARMYSVSDRDADGGPIEAYLTAIHPDDVAKVGAHIEHALSTGDAFSENYRLRAADGSWRHVEARGKVTFGADGLPEWLPGIALDVTAQKEAEARLQRSEARFRRLAESNVLGIVQYRADGALLDPNDAFLDILGVTRAEFERAGLSWRALTPPEWREADERGWAQLRATGVMEPYEKEYLRSDGSRAAVYLGAANVEGNPDEGISYVLDISGIRAAERALKESEARFRVIANAMPQAVWSTRPDGFHDYYNDQWYAFTGMPYGSTDGDAWNGLFHPDDQAAAWDKWRHSLRTGEPYEIEYRLRHHSGHYRWALGRALPVRAEDGSIVRWMGTCTDIHEQKLTQQALQENDRRKDEFLAMLAHELRNPLAPIATAASLLTMAAQDPARVRQVGAVISRQTAHMTGLIDDLMDVSRVTRGLVTLEREDLTLAQVIDDAVEQVRPLVEGRTHRLELQAAGAAGIRVRGDRKRLVQVLANILGNAARYTPAGGHIVLKAGIDEGRAVLSVRDNGIGMSPELVASAFELFHQGTRSSDRAQGGLGIGLALVRSLVELHGGTVRAASQGEGRGSTFTVSLPLPEQGGATQAQADGVEPQAAPAALRVLVVDDNTDAAELVAMFLGLLGYDVCVEFSAAAALERARQVMPQVCLLDIGLPGMDGKELARRLRQMPGLEDVRLAAMTGYGQPHDRRETEAAGFDAHFVKPVETDALAAWLATAEGRGAAD